MVKEMPRIQIATVILHCVNSNKSMRQGNRNHNTIRSLKLEVATSWRWRITLNVMQNNIHKESLSNNNNKMLFFTEYYKLGIVLYTVITS